MANRGRTTLIAALSLVAIAVHLVLRFGSNVSRRSRTKR